MLSKENTITQFYYILPFGIFINLIFGWSWTSYHSPDSYTYISIAKELPNIKNAIFPIFYPLFLRLADSIFNSYDVAAKVINICCLIAIISFVKLKDFYWREIWVLLTFSSLQGIYPMIWSENLLLTLIIFYSYYHYKFLNNSMKSWEFILINILLFFLMFITKYNSIFFVIANFVFIIYLIRIGKRNLAFGYIVSTLISLVLFFFYLTFNFFMVGSIVGKRGMTADFNYLSYFYESLKNVSLTYNPFSLAVQRISERIKDSIPYSAKLNYLFSFFLTVVLFVKFQKLQKQYDLITKFFFINSFVFLVFTLIASYFVTLDILDYRLLLNFYLFLIFGVIQHIHSSNIEIKSRYAFCLGFISLFIFLLNLIIVKFL